MAVDPQTIEKMRRNELMLARNHLLIAISTLAPFNREYKEINELIEDIETMLGVQ